MINITKSADTLLIVVHEIYGINQHIKDMCKALAEQNFDVLCPNLLAEELVFDYTQEDIAYQNFMDKVGFVSASQKVLSLLADRKDQYKKVFVIGFSVGATIAWLCSEEKGIDGVVGYYGSRIRKYIDITPKCPTLLFFPQEEKSFNVDALIAMLPEDNVKTKKFTGLHGFSDPHAPQFDEQSARDAFDHMLNFFKENDSQSIG